MASEEMLFENVDGRMPAYAFGSGELKNYLFYQTLPDTF